MIHDLLQIVFIKYSAVYTEYEGSSVVFTIIVVLGIGVFWRHGLSLIFGAKLLAEIVFGRYSLVGLDVKDMILTVTITTTLTLNALHFVAIHYLN
jgi:hypothetical protein